ncbi:MAG: hypothetical protein PWQ56_417 [Patescibacteria group bacterium]|nr:hypothetical protein [Patescibacteria group bacterium]
MIIDFLKLKFIDQKEIKMINNIKIKVNNDILTYYIYNIDDFLMKERQKSIKYVIMFL